MKIITVGRKCRLLDIYQGEQGKHLFILKRKDLFIMRKKKVENLSPKKRLVVNELSNKNNIELKKQIANKEIEEIFRPETVNVLKSTINRLFREGLN